MTPEPTDAPQGCDRSLTDQLVEDVVSEPIDDEIELFASLANETRYRILLLVHAADGGVCGCELEPYLEVSQSSISQSLSRLRKAGLLSRTKQGRWRYYDTTELAEELLATLARGERESMVTA